MQKRSKWVPFGLILVLAILLRFVFINTVPPSPSLDEVSIGYNAYSILKTGADEFGYKLPILLRAYDDWRPALYVYLVIPFVAVLGMSAEAVRMPSVILSLISLTVSFFISKELFKKDFKFSKYEIPVENIPYIVMLLVAISPWHIYLSRLGHEVNLGLTVTVLGIYFFLRAVGSSKRGFVYPSMSAAFFAISIYSYQAQKVIIPLLVLGFLVIFRKKVMENLKGFLIAALVGIILSIPAVVVSVSSEGLTRLHATSVFSPEHPRIQERLLEFAEAKADNNFLEQIYYNRRLNNIDIFLTQYFYHYSPSWLFLGREKEDHKVPMLGLMYIWELIFFVSGMAVLLFSSLNKRIKLLIIYWILVSPIAGAMTTGAPHAMRSFTFIPSLQIVTSLGVIFFYVYLKDFMNARVLRFSFFILVLVTVTIFSYQYFIVFPRLHSSSFQYPLMKALEDLPDGKNVVVSNQNALNQSYMFYLFSEKINPKAYQEAGGSVSGGFAQEHRIGNVVFRPINFQDEKKGAILMGNINDFPENTLGKKYKALDGQDYILVVEK